MRQKRQLNRSGLHYMLGSGRNILDALGYDHIPGDHNPVWLALGGLSPFSDEELAELVANDQMSEQEAQNFAEVQVKGAELANKLRPILWKRGSKGAILRAHIICQTAILNTHEGPVSNGDLGTIRQRWYYSQVSLGMGFKFAAQALEQALVKSADVVLVDDARAEGRAGRTRGHFVGVEYKANWSKARKKEYAEALGRNPKVHIWPKSGWGRSYAQAQSQIMAELVREGMLYEHLWVRDASRDNARFNPLYQGFYGVLILEKEGLFDHFKKFSASAGIPLLISMSGNNAFSVVEALLNDNFRDWEGEYLPTADNPLHIFCISDHDYAGHVPVQNGAVAQFERYLPGATELHRIGVTPEQVRATGRSVVQAGYEFEADYNSAYQEWADYEGVWVGDSCYAIELDALPPQAYVADLVAAIVEAAGGDDALKEKLIKAAEPNWWEAQRKAAAKVEEMVRLKAYLDRLSDWCQDKIYEQVDSPSETFVNETMGEADGEWALQGDVQDAILEKVEAEEEKLTVENFTDFVDHSANHSAWTPVSNDAATQAVTDAFLDLEDEKIAEFVEELEEDTLDILSAVSDAFEHLTAFGLQRPS